MAKSINRVELLGFTGTDPEIKFTNGGTKVASFSLATHDQVIDKDGKEKRLTEWHRVKAFGKLADICEQYLRKGGRVYLEGSLRTSNWTDQAGVRHSVTEVVANNVIFLSKPEISETKEEGNA